MNKFLRLNLGSGVNKMDGYVNVDKFDYGKPDIMMDLEQTPWQFLDDSVEEIMLNHTLEHLGKDTQTFFAIIKEIYRVCKNNALIEINVPHPRHDNFISDPTHVRAITPMTLQLFDLELNEHWQQTRAANSPFAIYLGVNFKLLSTNINVEQSYIDQLNQNKITNEELKVLISERNNVATEYRFTLKVIKNEKP